MKNGTMYIDVILPLALANSYTYLVPEDMADDVRTGARVIVSFGAKKFYTALVYRIHNEKPELFEPKEIVAVLDEKPVVRGGQIKLWEWIASYYQCTLGEVYKAALPAGLKLESETVIALNEEFVAESVLKPKEQQLLDLFAAKSKLSVADINKALQLKNSFPLVKRLMDMGALVVSEEVKEKFRPKRETFVSLSPECADEDALRSVFDGLKGARRQLDLLMFFLNESRFFSKTEAREVSKKELLEKGGFSASVFSALVEKNIFVVHDKEVGRLGSVSGSLVEAAPLSDAQSAAYREIIRQFREKQTVLLHGVTSSGKTEIYIHLINEMLKLDKQVLFLLPEIALTTQITNRLKRVFGSQLGVYHSKFSDNERVEIWNNLLKDDGYKVILGVRSSIFLPFRDLGLVIVDEEHENSYKQYDPAPRYNARNAAVMLAHFSKAKVLLGSATPSVESYFAAKSGKFGLVELFTRFGNVNMPEVIIADVAEARRKKEMTGLFTETLLNRMSEALSRKEQVILFQNRRGFAPYVECRSCSAVPKCKNCDVSLTYHKFSNQLSCHYCGYTYAKPEKCPACGNPTIDTVGFGTEKIEEEVHAVFPEARVARLDLDVARSRKNFESVIADFEAGKIDVLVGTQMISKGLDFERVRVVGVLSADMLLNYPDFRSHERAFQLMAQVSGRAGRKNGQGIVVIQTTSPEHVVMEQVRSNDYAGMYEMQVEERQLFNYPPYFRLVYIYVKGRDERVVDGAANYLAQCMKATFGHRIVGPDRPVIPRVQNMYIRKIMVKFEQNISADKAKSVMREYVDHTLATDAFKSVIIYFDVDPM